MASETKIVTVPFDQLKPFLETLVRDTVAGAVERFVEPRFLTIGEVAQMLSVCEKTVKTLIHGQGLPVARKLGTQWRFDRDAVVTWMNNGAAKADTKPKLRKVS